MRPETTSATGGRLCRATTKAGKPCGAVAIKNGLCNLHSQPGRAAELGKLSGRARRYSNHEPESAITFTPPQTAKDVQSVLGRTIAQLQARKLDPRTATAIGYLANVLLKSIETSDLDERLTRLEDLNKSPEGGSQ